MNYLTVLFSIIFLANTMLIFDFKEGCSLRNWRIVDDVVMGGRSDGNMFLNEEGHGVFKGEVSLENYGGFSSVRYQFSEKNVNNVSTVVLRVKGDGKRYQFRVKSNKYDRFSYITYFDTSGKWEDIELNLKDMYPTFRGRRLNIPNYPKETLEEIAILIGNKKEEAFMLEIDKILLK